MPSSTLEDVNQSSHKRMKPGHKETANKIEPGQINSVFYRFKDLKMNVHYKIPLNYRQPISDCMVAYLYRVTD